MREGPGDGVAAALRLIGAGFLRHPDSDALRAALRQGRLDGLGYYRELLRLAYRLLFLLVLRGRGLLAAPIAMGADSEGLSALRALWLPRPVHGQDPDLWLDLVGAFRRLRQAGRPLLPAYPFLGGEIFGPRACVHLEGAACDGGVLREALLHLTSPGARGPLDFAAVEVDWLGAVHEGLLELHPTVDLDGDSPFHLAAGRGRKAAGAYYTPTELVQELIDRALVPVVEERLAGARSAGEAERALLDLRVCDPSCGGGRFLLASARRLALDLARRRTGEVDPPTEVRRSALADVARACLHGVDRDPLAVELFRLALWVEGDGSFEEPGFLTDRIRVGDALVGAFDLRRVDGGRGPEVEGRPSRAACDRWTAAFFARAGSETDGADSSGRPYFHWPLEFPGVFEAGGFDVVLGNPPFSANLSEGARRLVRATLPATRSNTNTAVAFLQRARELLRRGGRFGLVVPRSLIFSGEWARIRAHLFDEVLALIDAGQAFREVRLEQVLLVGGTRPADRVVAGRLREGGPEPRVMDKEVWRSAGVWLTGLSKLEAGLLDRVKGLPRLGELARIYRGVGLQGALRRHGELEVFGGAEIGVSGLLEARGRVDRADLGSAGGRLLLPKVMAQNVVAHVKRPRPHAWIKAAVDEAGLAVPLDTVNCLVPTSEELSLVEIALLLNSRFASWYATRFIYTDAQRTMHFDAGYAGRIPLPDFGPLRTAQRMGGTGFPTEPCPLGQEAATAIVYELLQLDEVERIEIDSYFSSAR